MQDNLVYATDTLRNSITAIKKKLSNIKIVVEQFDVELERIDAKFDKFLVQAEIYKTRLDRELGREARKLEQEIVQLKKTITGNTETDNPQEQDARIASTIAVFESIVRFISEGSDDFRLASYSFLFPAVYEKVAKGDEEAYFLEEIPTSTLIVIKRGRDYLEWIRKECDTHLIEPESWEKYSQSICDWWRNDALPLIYGSRDEQWDIEVPMSLTEMLIWRDEPSERPIHFPKIFDVYEVYRVLKDRIYESTGLREFDLKMFSYNNNG